MIFLMRILILLKLKSCFSQIKPADTTGQGNSGGKVVLDVSALVKPLNDLDTLSVRLESKGPTYSFAKSFSEKKGFLYGVDDNNSATINAIETKNRNGDKCITASIINERSKEISKVGCSADGNIVLETRLASEYPEEIDPLRDESISEDMIWRQLKETFDETAHNRIMKQSSSVIDTMVVWTRNSECGLNNLASGCTLDGVTFDNMMALIELAILETNTAYTLSGINTQLNLVHAYREEDYIETGFSSSLYDITNFDGVIDDVHTKREKYGADIVALLIDPNPTGWPSSCGVAWLGPYKSHMFSVTHWYCATGYYTFGHEIGHNMGCNHDKGTSDTCGSSAYNYGYRDPDADFRSILAYNCASGQCDNNAGGGCVRVQRFSNTFSSYNGKPMGDSVTDNARHINRVSATIAAYYESVSSAPSSPPEIISSSPSLVVSSQPSSAKSLGPTEEISSAPSSASSESPSQKNSNIPSIILSQSPSFDHSISPSSNPSSVSSSFPTTAMSSSPTEEKSSSPSLASSGLPSKKSSNSPSKIFSNTPTNDSSSSPSLSPSFLMSSSPTLAKSSSPTLIKSSSPSLASSDKPSRKITNTPSKISSNSPSANSFSPTIMESISPTKETHYTNSPSQQASIPPSFILSNTPSFVSSDPPTLAISSIPSQVFSSSPSIDNSVLPTLQTSSIPTIKNSMAPSILISSSPTLAFSESPSKVKSHSPTSITSESPSYSPIILESTTPTMQISISSSTTRAPVAPIKELGFCVQADGSDQNSGVIKLSRRNAGPKDRKTEECLDLCIEASKTMKVTGCEAIWWQYNRGCYIHTKPISHGNGVDRHICWIFPGSTAAPSPSLETTPMQEGDCVKNDDAVQNTGVIRIKRGSAGPSPYKQEECFSLCLEESGKRGDVTGCEAIWKQRNKGCYIHTQTIAHGNGATNHGCWVFP